VKTAFGRDPWKAPHLVRYESTHADGKAQLCTEEHASKREAPGDSADESAGFKDVHSDHGKAKTNHQGVHTRGESQAEQSAG